MAEFIAEHWELINWQTAIVGVVVLVPIAGALFWLIAGRSSEDLKAEKFAHEKTKNEKNELANEIHRLHEQNTTLLARLEVRRHEESWRDIELSDEEKVILVAISEDKMNRLYGSKKISDQRIRLAQDRLLELGLIAEGFEGNYARPAGRKWLEAHGSLK